MLQSLTGLKAVVIDGLNLDRRSAEGVGDINLSTDKRGDMLCLSGVLHTSY